MIRDRFFIDKYGWKVTIFYDAASENASEILNTLREAGCKGDFMQTAERSLTEGEMNTGLTYSNMDEKKTIIVIGRASSTKELLNTLQHEQRHLETHIARRFNMDPYGEEICYLAGEVAEKTFGELKIENGKLKIGSELKIGN